MSYTEITLDQGTTFSKVITLKNDDGSAKNLANNTFTSQIRKSYYTTSLVSNVTVTVTDAANGKLTLSLDAANTAIIKAGRYLYDVKMTSNTSIVTRVSEGIITVTPSITK